MPPIPPATLVDVLCDRAADRPNQTALIFLKDGETEAERLTYAELDRQARAIAVDLRTQMPAGSRALLVYPYEAGSAFVAAFLGCLYAGIVAVPCHPPRNRTGLADLRARLASAEAAMILTTPALLANLKRQLAEANRSLLGLTPAAGAAAAWTSPDLNGDSLAFLQYTSGSTGMPKGVVVTHRNLLHNQQMLQLAFGHSAETIGVGWLPLFHDMGLIGNLLQVLYLGATGVLMSPIAFIQKPIRWLEAISRYRATTSGGPNFAYELLCRRVTEPQLKGLDLSSWQVAFSGAEPVRAATLERFVARFAACGFRRSAFYPCYGMAEATLFISGGQKSALPVVATVSEAALEQHRVELVDRQEQGRTFVGCGWAWLDGTLAIVDPDSQRRCPPDRVGEIWVAGSGIGNGYWNQPEESDRLFRAFLSDSGEGPFLRTGDLGFIHEGELYITGRRHDVLVFWGFNHYPQHIEQTVETCHPAFRQGHGAAVAVPVQGEERLVIVQEVDRRYRDRVSIDEVVEAVRWAVFQEHFIDVYAIVLLKPGGLPKTSSGKVQRQRCKAKFLDGSLERLGEWRSPHPDQSDISSLIHRYLNPLTHLKRYSALVRGRLRRSLSIWPRKTS